MLSHIESAARAGTRIHFVDSSGSTAYDLSDLCSQGARSAGALGEGVVAALLDASPDCLRFLLAALQAGTTVVSLPLPSRGASVEAYQEHVLNACVLASATRLLIPARFASLLPPLPLDVFTFEELPMGRSVQVGGRGKFAFIQFTSGSTGDPRGVVLPGSKIAANVDAILEVLQPAPGDVPCSWLPWSHDMGLIGMLFASLVGASEHWANGADIVFMHPEHFIARPDHWLRAASEFGATITALPDFGLRLATAAVRRSAILDLSSIRACIVGAEPVQVGTLRGFTQAFGDAGFRDRAFCPAYGLAEVALAVSLTSPTSNWQFVSVDAAALAARTVVPTSAPGARELVSAGEPLTGYEISTSPCSAEVGLIEVRGPSLLDDYLGGEECILRDGPLQTADLGFMSEGQLYVTGRSDDVLLLAGRKVYVTDIEAAVESAGLSRAGGVIAAPTADGYAVAVELAPEAEGSATALAAAIRQVVVGVADVNPASIWITERKVLPKTSSGKPRRNALSELIQAETLPALHIAHYK